MAFSPNDEIAVMAIVPGRDTRPARNIDEWITNELALADAYAAAIALELKRRNSPAFSHYDVVQSEYRLCGVLAAHAERNLNRTLRRVDGLRHN
jgi:hypothetical protein